MKRTPTPEALGLNFSSQKAMVNPEALGLMEGSVGAMANQPGSIMAKLKIGLAKFKFGKQIFHFMNTFQNKIVNLSLLA